jgi:hypothetical protein
MNFNKTRISCHALQPIMSNHSTCKALTGKQSLELSYLLTKGDLTKRQQETLDKLEYKKENQGRSDVLSPGCISKLKDLYVREKYHKQVVNIAKDYSPAILNGTLSESKSLGMLSEIDGIRYKTHKKLIKNDHLKGILDAYSGKSARKASKVIEVKTCANMQSLVNIIGSKDISSMYYWQIMGYLAITGADEGEICHCLVSYPERVIKDEINRFLFKAKSFDFDGEYIQTHIDRIRHNLTFDDIPIHERMYRFKVQRDDDAISRIYEKVKHCRKWLNSFNKLHTNTNKLSYLYIESK